MKLFVIGCIVGLSIGVFLGKHFRPAKSPPKIYSDARLQRVTNIAVPKQKSNIVPTIDEVIPKIPKLIVSENKVLEIEANNILSEAILAGNSGNFKQALDLFNDVYRKIPSSKKVLEQFSNFLVMGGLWEDALPILEKCVLLHTDSNLCQGNLVNYSLETEDLDDQLEAIETCLESDSSNLQCLNAMGIHSLATRQFDKALQAYTKMSQVNGKNNLSTDEALIDWGMGLSYNGLGDIEDAKDYFSKACHKRFEPACIELDKINL